MARPFLNVLLSMKPTTKILILLACFVSPIFPFIPVTGATPIPPTNNLDFGGDAIPNPQSLMPSFSARDASIVDSGDSRLARDSFSGSNYLDTKTLLFSRMFGFEQPVSHHAPPQLVFDDSIEATLQAAGKDQVTRKQLEEQLKETQSQLKNSAWETEHHDVVIHLIETNDALVSLDLELVANGKLTYKEYRPKIIHIIMELVKLYRDNWNLFDISACSRSYIDKYLEVEARHNKIYGCMKLRGPHSSEFFADELLKELEEQRRDMVAGNEELSEEERESKSSQLHQAALSSNVQTPLLTLISQYESAKDFCTVLALREAAAMKSIHVGSMKKAKPFQDQLREIVKVAKGNSNEPMDVRMYAKAICRHLYTKVNESQQSQKLPRVNIGPDPKSGFHLQFAEAGTLAFNVLLLPQSLKDEIPDDFTTVTLAKLAESYSKASLTNDENSEKNITTSWQLWTMVARILLDYSSLRDPAQTILDRIKKMQFALEPSGLGRRLDEMVKYLEGEQLKRA